MPSPLLVRLREQRDSVRQTMETTVEEVAVQNRDMTETEQTNFDASETELRELDARIEQLSGVELRNAEAARLAAEVDQASGTTTQTRGAAGVSRINEPDMYSEGSGHGYFYDLVQARNGDLDAAGRLQAHNAVETRANSTAATAGGEFVPPRYLLDQYAAVVRGQRPLADAMPSYPFPGTTSWLIPRITTGTLVGVQSSENSAFSHQDQVTDNVTVNAQTIGGYTDMSMQLLDMNGTWDSIIFADLARAHAELLETKLCQSTATGAKGLFTVSGTNAITYTDASPTPAEAWPKLAGAVQAVQDNRLSEPQVIVAAPRRWTWFRSSVDSQGRPWIAPVAPQNAGGLFGNLTPEGVSGELFGLPVLTTHGVPKTNGGGTEDEIAVGVLTDTAIWESPKATLVDPYSGSANGTVRLRLTSYVGWTFARYPAGWSIISGTGLASPVF